MNRKLSFIVLVLLISGVSIHPTIARAVLVDLEDFTYDTDTNFLWLDLKHTAGFSYEEILLATGVGGPFYGLTFASMAQVSTLFEHAATPQPAFSHCANSPTPAACDLFEFLVSGSTPEATSMWIMTVDTPVPRFTQMALISQKIERFCPLPGTCFEIPTNEYRADTHLNVDFWGPQRTGYRTALYMPLPNAVPVPAAAWLFGTALIGFVGLSRRRKVA